MNTYTLSKQCWKTATRGNPANISPLDVRTLEEHLGSCQPAHRCMFALHCVADKVHGFVAARFVTTLLACALLAGAASWLF